MKLGKGFLIIGGVLQIVSGMLAPEWLVVVTGFITLLVAFLIEKLEE